MPLWNVPEPTWMEWRFLICKLRLPMGGSWSVIGKESLAIQGVGLVLIIAAMCWLGILSNILFEPVWSLPDRGGSILLWFIGSHLEKCMHFNGRASRPGCFRSCVVKDPLNRDDAQASFNTLAIKKKKKKKTERNGDFWNRGYIWNDPGLRITYRSRLSFEKDQKLESYKSCLLESLLLQGWVMFSEQNSLSSWHCFIHPLTLKSENSHV